MYHRYPGRLSRIVQQVADQTVDAWQQDKIRQEPQITDWFMCRIDDKLNSHQMGKIAVEVRVFSPAGPVSEESRVGADFANILEIRFEGFRVRKGFLAQAKKMPRHRVDRNRVITEVLSDNQLARQCEKMLAITPASFVFVYKSDGFAVFPALDVHSLLVSPPPRPDAYLYHKSIRSFYEEFFKTFVGDRLIGLPIESMDQLDSFARDYQLRHALYLRITGRVSWSVE